MVNLRCKDYGYKCEYMTNGEIDKIVDDYKEHMNDIHGMDYFYESLFYPRQRFGEDRTV